MNTSVEYLLNRASEAEIIEHLSHCDNDFVPPLSNRTKINDYASKIIGKATRFEAWLDGMLIGLVAAYCNDKERHIAYITSVSVLRAHIGKGIASSLVSRCIEYSKTSGMRCVSLEVASDNASAIGLYAKCGFVVGEANGPFLTMAFYPGNGEGDE